MHGLKWHVEVERTAGCIVLIDNSNSFSAECKLAIQKYPPPKIGIRNYTFRALLMSKVHA